MPKPMLTDTGFATFFAIVADVVGRHRRVGEQQVRAGFGVEVEAPDRFGEAVRRQHVGARLDDEIGIDARVRRGADLLHHLLGGDHFLALQVAAALRPHLVLEHQAGHARALERAHRVMHVDRIAVAGVGVGEQQEIRARAIARAAATFSSRPISPTSGWPSRDSLTPLPVMNAAV